MTRDEPPITYPELRDLFAFLNDTSATGHECDHRFTLVERFLRDRNLPIPPMLAWLGRNGAGCDCEAVFNTGAQWEERVGYVPPNEDE
jgi:hypothetical protein